MPRRWPPTEDLGGDMLSTNNLSDVADVPTARANLGLEIGVDVAAFAAYLLNLIEDTTPQLGGALDVNGFKIVSAGGANIDIEPNGTGNVLLGNFTFDADQTVGAGQDNYVLTYDNATGLISLEPAGGGVPALITVANEAADTTSFISFFTAATGDLGPKTNAGLTFNASTADLSSTLIGGIAVANLLDKSAAETITGAWTFSSASNVTISTTGTNGFYLSDPVSFEFGLTRLSATDEMQFVASRNIEFMPQGSGSVLFSMSSSVISAPTLDADFDDITATSYGGIIEANLVDKSAAETITGDWDFSNSGSTFAGAAALVTLADESADTTCFPLFATAATGNFGPKTASGLTFNSSTDDLNSTLIAGIANANLVDKSDVETITGIWTFQGAPAVVVQAASAAIDIQQTGATADEGNWIIRANSDELRIQTASDAAPNTGVVNAIRFLRAGTDVSNTIFDSAVDILESLDVTGALTALSYDGVLAANLLDKTATETVSGSYTFTASPIITNNLPRLDYRETGETDRGNWITRVSAGAFGIYTATDADPTTVLETLISGARNVSGVLTSVDIGGTTLNNTGVIITTQDRTAGIGGYQRWVESSSSNRIEALMNTTLWVLRPYPAGASDPARDFIYDFPNNRWSFDEQVNFAAGPINIGSGLTFTIPAFTIGLRVADAANTDYGEFTHDGTEFNFTFVNTTNVDFSGQTALRVMLGSDFRILDSANTDYMSMSHDGTEFNFLSVNTTNVDFQGQTRFRLLSGSEFRLLDSTNADSVTFVHDGTDFNTTFVGTLDWNISDLTFFRLFEGVTLQVWDTTNTDRWEVSHNGTDVSVLVTNTGLVSNTGASVGYRWDAPLYLLERAAANADTAAYGQLWVRNDTPNVLVFTDDAGTDTVLGVAGGVPTLITVANEAADATSFPLFVTAATGDLGPKTNAGFIFNASTGDLSSTLIGGIAVANLVDKSAAEAITGAWTFGTAAQVELLGGTDLWVRAAGFLRIYDSTDTDHVQFSHDGTDFNIAGTTTAELNITGMNVNFNGNQAVEFRLENRTSDPGSPTVGQMWLRTDL
jgi:hypothetical protein